MLDLEPSKVLLHYFPEGPNYQDCQIKGIYFT